MIKISDYISMDEYYVIHSYQVKPKIKYLLVKKFMCNMYIILHVMYFITYKHMTYYIIFIIHLYAKKYSILIFFVVNIF
jgi:hypothetical protein